MDASISRAFSIPHATLLPPRTRGNTVKGQAMRGAPRLSGRAGRSLSACEEARHLVGQCQRHPCLHLFATRIAKDQRETCSLTSRLWYLAQTVLLLLLLSRATPRTRSTICNLPTRVARVGGMGLAAGSVRGVASEIQTVLFYTMLPLHSLHVLCFPPTHTRTSASPGWS